MTAVLLANQEGQVGNAWLFGLLAATWTAGEAGLRGPGVATPVLLWIGGFTHVVAAAVLLRYPGSGLDRAGRLFVIAFSAVLGVIQAGLLLTSTPGSWEQPVPDAPWLTLWHDERLNESLWFVRYAVWGVGGALFLVLLWRRWGGLTAVERRPLAPILITAAVTAVFIALRLVDDFLPDDVALVLAVTRTFCATAVSAAFVLSAVQMKLARAGIAELATELAQSATVERVSDSLRRALSDPTLEVLYWVSEQQVYVDAEGVVRNPSHDSDRRIATTVTAEGAPLAIILADPALRRNRSLVDSAVAVSRLAMENAQLQASLRSQLVAVRDARMRLLHTGLEQRRRLERDLHDGAQQRLLALSMRLGVIQNSTTNPTTAAAVERAQHELQQALDELRDLAHGLYPAVLSQAGLGAALEAVVERLPVPVNADITRSRFHPDVESAAYLIACEALTNACKHAGECTVHLAIARNGEDLVIDVSDDGLGLWRLDGASPPRAIRDRVDAMGGSVSITSGPGLGTRLIVEIPCE